MTDEEILDICGDEINVAFARVFARTPTSQHAEVGITFITMLFERGALGLQVCQDVELRKELTRGIKPGEAEKAIDEQRRLLELPRLD